MRAEDFTDGWNAAPDDDGWYEDYIDEDEADIWGDEEYYDEEEEEVDEGSSEKEDSAVLLS